MKKHRKKIKETIYVKSSALRKSIKTSHLKGTGDWAGTSGFLAGVFDFAEDN